MFNIRTKIGALVTASLIMITAQASALVGTDMTAKTEPIDMNFIMERFKSISPTDFVNAAKDDGVVYSYCSSKLKNVCKVGVGNYKGTRKDTVGPSTRKHMNKVIVDNPTLYLDIDTLKTVKCGTRLKCLILEGTVHWHLHGWDRWMSNSVEGGDIRSGEIFNVSQMEAMTLFTAYNMALEPFDPIIEKLAKKVQWYARSQLGRHGVYVTLRKTEVIAKRALGNWGYGISAAKVVIK